MLGLYYLLIWCAFGASVRDLGADSFDARQAAEARLSRWYWLASPLLSGAHRDLEVRKRIGRITTWPPAPLATLSGVPLLEWARPDCDIHQIGIAGECPGTSWVLTWVRPDRQAPLAGLIRHYHERARRQRLWADWYTATESRHASRLLAHDLYRLGLPAPLVRRWLAEQP